MHVFGSVSCEASRYFFSNVFENIICSLSLMFLKIISAAWEVFCGVSLRSILNPADSSKHWLSAQSLNILLLGDHFVFPGLTDTVKTSNHVKVVSTTNPQCQEFEKKQGLCDLDWGEGGWELLLVTWPQKSTRLPAEFALSVRQSSPGRRRRVVLNCCSRPSLMLFFFF